MNQYKHCASVMRCVVAWSVVRQKYGGGLLSYCGFAPVRLLLPDDVFEAARQAFRCERMSWPWLGSLPVRQPAR